MEDASAFSGQTVPRAVIIIPCHAASTITDDEFMAKIELGIHDQARRENSASHVEHMIWQSVGCAHG